MQAGHPSWQSAVVRLRRRILTVLGLRLFLIGLVWAAPIFGVGILLSRMLVLDMNPRLPVLLTVVSLLAYSSWRAFGRLPSDAALLALLEARDPQGGLLLAAGEYRLGSWQTRLRTPRIPQIRWQWGAHVTFLFLGLGFALVAALLPGSWFDHEQTYNSGVIPLIRELQDQVNTLPPHPELDALRAQLEELSDQERDPSDWEALDHLRSQLEKANQTQMERASSELDATGLMADMLEELSANNLTSSEHAQAMEALEHLTGNLTSEFGGGLTLNQAMSKQQRQELLKKMRDRQSQLENQLAQLKQLTGTIPEGSMPVSNGSSKEAKDKLAKFLEGQANKCESKLVTQCLNGGLCSGGIRQGPGHVALTWKEGPAAEGPFRETALPPGQLADFSENDVIGLSFTAPPSANPVTDKPAPSLGRGQTAPAGGREASFLPRHRGAVRRYFQPSSPSETPTGSQ